jgi:type IV secretion system protein VirD4
VRVVPTARAPASRDDDDVTDSERRHQPELRRVEAAETLAPMTDDFILDKAPEDDALRARRMTHMMRGVAQQAALDPADNMNL